jgi:hypothetical protein
MTHFSCRFINLNRKYEWYVFFATEIQKFCIDNRKIDHLIQRKCALTSLVFYKMNQTESMKPSCFLFVKKRMFLCSIELNLHYFSETIFRMISSHWFFKLLLIQHVNSVKATYNVLFLSLQRVRKRTCKNRL